MSRFTRRITALLKKDVLAQREPRTGDECERTDLTSVVAQVFPTSLRISSFVSTNSVTLVSPIPSRASGPSSFVSFPSAALTHFQLSLIFTLVCASSEITMRTVGCKEVAEDHELQAKVLRLYREVESSSSMVTILFPWFPGTFSRTFVVALARRLIADPTI